MAAGAQLRGCDAELGGARIGDVMHPVAVGADRNVGVARLDERRSVDAVPIVLEYPSMATATGLGDPRPGLIRKLNVVRSMAVGAHRGLNLPGRGCLRVHAVQGAIVVGRVAGAAGQVQAAGEVPAGGEVDHGVGVVGDLRMAGIAADAEALVHRSLERFRRDEERQALAAGEGETERRIPVAGQAGL